MFDSNLKIYVHKQIQTHTNKSFDNYLYTDTNVITIHIYLSDSKKRHIRYIGHSDVRVCLKLQF